MAGGGGGLPQRQWAYRRVGQLVSVAPYYTGSLVTAEWGHEMERVQQAAMTA